MSLEWNQLPLSGSLIYSADIKDRGRNEITARLAEFWVKLLEVIGGACRDDEWEVLYVEVTADEGAVVGYPGGRQWGRRARVRVDVRLAWYEQRGEALRKAAWARLAAAEASASASDWGRDETFREGYQKLFAGICRLLRAAADDERASAALRQAKTRKPFVAYAMDSPNGVMVRSRFQLF